MLVFIIFQPFSLSAAALGSNDQEADIEYMELTEGFSNQFSGGYDIICDRTDYSYVECNGFLVSMIAIAPELNIFPWNSRGVILTHTSNIPGDLETSEGGLDIFGYVWVDVNSMVSSVIVKLLSRRSFSN